eukprot:5741599-Amphidinium_carterae.1
MLWPLLEDMLNATQTRVFTSIGCYVAVDHCYAVVIAMGALLLVEVALATERLMEVMHTSKAPPTTPQARCAAPKLSSSSTEAGMCSAIQ